MPIRALQRLKQHRTRHLSDLKVVSKLMPSLAQTTDRDYYTRAANEDDINGGLRTRTKYAYDSIGRPQTKIYTEDGTNYQFDYAYNSLGATDTLTYPVSTSGVRFELKYLYDTAGYLNEVKDASAGTPFWTLTGAGDSSAPTMEVLGNAVSVATGYTPWTNEMVARTEGSAGSTTNLQNLSYAWDLNGNLLQRVDNRQNLTEKFTLDALNRLSTVTLNGTQTLSVQYDQAGDIANKSDVGAYTYGSTAHPHAVTAAGSWTIGYDANGNMNSRAGGAITSYSYNLPNQINYNGSSSQFNYDSSHQRWKQVANYAGTTETIHYIGGLLQVVTDGSSPTEYRHQIPAGSSTAVYTRRTDGTTGTYYATSDHLGSADLVMDGSANVLVRESFSSFGARRGTNWQGIPTTSDYTAIQSTTRKGFTGHEMLDSVGLIHMNGRVYDPTLGRFLSADSLVSNLVATQSVNPYSYAWNDPLRYIDASGHGFLDVLFEIVDLVVAAVLAYFTFGGASAAFGAGFGATAAAGAASGFVGGFVGTALMTGNLSAAFSAGLTGALAGGLFAGIGYYADQSKYAWDTGEKMLAHAAVGCVQGALSGSCGKGALAAAVSEAASLSGVIKPKAFGTWGSLRGTVESGFVGGLAARVVGGKFTDGFSVAAAGYLLNNAGPKSAASKRADMASAALNAVAAATDGDTTYTTENDSKWPAGYKCNEFVYDMGEAAGIDMPTINGVPIKAYQWAYGDAAVGAAGFERVYDPQPGDIIASAFGTEGHVGIIVAPGMTVSAASTSALDGVTENDWGFRGPLDVPTILKTYWRYTGTPQINWGK